MEENLIPSSNGLIKVDEGRVPCGFVLTDIFGEEIFGFHSLLYAGEVFLIFQILFPDLVKSFLFGFKFAEFNWFKEVSEDSCFFEYFEAHFEVAHLEADEVIYEDFIEGVEETEIFAESPELFDNEIRDGAEFSEVIDVFFCVGYSRAKNSAQLKLSPRGAFHVFVNEGKGDEGGEGGVGGGEEGY